MDNIISRLRPIMRKLEREAIANKQAKVENQYSDALQLLIDFRRLLADYDSIKASRGTSR
jgi:hypothetical protein